MKEHRFLSLLLYLAFCAAAIFLLFRFLLPVLLPFLIGLLLAQLGEPAVRLLERRGRLPRRAAACLSMAALFLLLSLLLYLLGLVCASELGRLSRRLPALLLQLRGPAEALRRALLALAGRVPGSLGDALLALIRQLFSGTSELLQRASGRLLSAASGLVSQVPGVFLFLLTTVVSSFMLSAEREQIQAFLRARIPSDARRQLLAFVSRGKTALAGWFRAELCMTGITFALLCVGFFALRTEAPLLLAGAVALLDALPVFGTGTVLIPWGAVCLLQGDTARGIGLLLLYGLAIALRTTLEPRLVGKQIGLNPLLSLLAMYAGFRLFGIGGMILLPIAALLFQQFWVYGGFGA